jgi:hypothetical protein
VPAADHDHVIYGRSASCSAAGSQQGKNPREEKECPICHIAKIVEKRKIPLPCEVSEKINVTSHGLAWLF